MKKQLLLSLSICLHLSVFAQQVLTRTNTTTTTNKSWQVYRQNSPGNTYSTSFNLLEVNYDSVLNHAGYVKIDILDNRLGYSPTKKFISADNNGYLQQGSFDNLTFPISQIVNLNSMLMDRITFAQAASIYQPIGAYLLGADTVSLDNRINFKLNKSDTTFMLSPYFRSANFNSTFDTRFGAKSTTNLNEGSNKYYTDARVQTFSDIRYKLLSYTPSNSEVILALGGTPLFSEIDGSITNEIELPAQTGQSGKVLSTNGTIPLWVTQNPGTVASVAISSTNLTVGGTNPVTSSGTITVNLSNTGTSGTYGIVVTDAQGRVTSGKRQQPYSGVTDASGNYTVTFSTAYSVAPNIQVCLINPNVRDTQIPTVTATGFTINIQRRTDVLGLLPTYANVVGGAIDVMITEK